MKKILFAAHSLGLGGIETALITLLEELAKKEYEITLVLEKKEGIFLDTLNSKIKVIEYCPSNQKKVPIRKAINMFKQLKFRLKYKNKFDFAAAYATYSLSNGFVARTASKNSTLWVHLDYLTQNNNNEELAKNYYKELRCEDFKQIIFVSEEAKENFLKLFPDCKEKAIYCNNLIDGEKILKKAKEQILEPQEEKVEESITEAEEGPGKHQKDSDNLRVNVVELEQKNTTFLNVGRHDEKQKQLLKLITVAEMLKQDGYKFKILFVGDGQDTNLYKEMVKNKKLEDTIIFMGKKKNPYPYYKISDCVVLTSDYEGYPVVFLESMILKKPIITTNVSDYKTIEGKYGQVTTKEIDSIYKAMKNFIENGFEIKEEFDYKKYNEEIIQKLEKIF